MVSPTTVFVDAPGAASVEVYVQQVDLPYGGMPVGLPTLIGSASIADGTTFAITRAADEPFPFVEVFAIAYGQPDVNYSRASAPITMLLDWP